MPHKRRQRIRVYTREVLVRLSAFRGTLFLFLIGTGIGSFLLRMKYHLGFLESVYQAVTLMFFASTLEYPGGDPIYEIIWIFFPLFGLLMLAQSLEGIGSAIRFGDPTSKEWNQEVIKITEEHIIVAGIGNLGIRVLDELVETGQDIVIIDKVIDPEKKHLLESYQRKYRIPLVKGDASQDNILLQANVAKAKAMMILIDDDLINLKIATKVRKLSPDIQLIVRMFDLEFGKELAVLMNFSLFSTTKIAVSRFIDELGLSSPDEPAFQETIITPKQDQPEETITNPDDPPEEYQ